MKSGRPALLLIVATCVTLLTSIEARAANGIAAVTLNYSAAEGCPSSDDFKAIVDERLGTEAFAENSPTHVAVRISSRGASLEGNMEWLDSDGNWAGERTFPAQRRDCEDLVRAMAFTLALQLQLSAVANSPQVTRNSSEAAPAQSTKREPPPPVVAKTPAPTKVVPPRIESPSRAQESPTLTAGVGAFVGFGMAPSALPFARVFVSVTRPSWLLELGAAVSSSPVLRRADGAGFSSQQLLGSVAGCGVHEVWSACWLVKAGAVRVSGKDIDDPATAGGAILETGIRGALTQRLYRGAHITAFAEGLVSPIRWSVTLDQNTVWTSPRFAGTTGIDLAWSFQ